VTRGMAGRAMTYLHARTHYGVIDPAVLAPLRPIWRRVLGDQDINALDALYARLIWIADGDNAALDQAAEDYRAIIGPPPSPPGAGGGARASDDDATAGGGDGWSVCLRASAQVARTLLADLVDRGLDPDQAILVVIDGAEALQARDQGRLRRARTGASLPSAQRMS
jgi:hypothetical protein